jgi:hypothetical protein
MLDPEWMLKAAMLAGAPVEEGAAGKLAVELDDQREVLPHLLLLRGGFADWPATRKALRAASKAVIRPRAQIEAAGQAATQQARETARQAIERTLAPHNEGDGWQVDAMIRLRPRLSRVPQPNDFIDAG